MLSALATKFYLLLLSTLILLKVSLMTFAVLGGIMGASFLGCVFDGYIDPWSKSNRGFEMKKFVASHSVQLQQGEVVRLRDHDFGDNYIKEHVGEFTTVSPKGYYGSVTFAFYEDMESEWMFVSPVVYSHFCHPIYVMIGGRDLSHVTLFADQVHYSDGADREYSWRFGERRARRPRPAR